jgi:hypothetical protein
MKPVSVTFTYDGASCLHVANVDCRATGVGTLPPEGKDFFAAWRAVRKDALAAGEKSPCS